MSATEEASDNLIKSALACYARQRQATKAWQEKNRGHINDLKRISYYRIKSKLAAEEIDPCFAKLQSDRKMKEKARKVKYYIEVLKPKLAKKKQEEEKNE